MDVCASRCLSKELHLLLHDGTVAPAIPREALECEQNIVANMSHVSTFNSIFFTDTRSEIVPAARKACVSHAGPILSNFLGLI